MNHSSTIHNSSWDRLIGFYTKPGDIELIRLSLKDTPSQNDLDQLLNMWDIEVKGGNKSLLLSYFQKFHPELHFDETISPRIKGLINFYRYNNVRLAAEYRGIVRILNENNIFPLIFKGGGIRHLRPDLPRNMGDIDIVISNTDFDKANTIISELGLIPVDNGHSVDWYRNGNPLGILDVHRYIPLRVKDAREKSGTIPEQKYLDALFSRAQQTDVWGTQSLVPTHEDMLFIILINLAKNVFLSTSIPGLMFSIYDCAFLQKDKQKFDWDIVFDNIELSQTYEYFGFAVQFVERIAPGIFPDMVNSRLSSDRRFTNFKSMLYHQQKRAHRKRKFYGKYLLLKLVYGISILSNQEKPLIDFLLRNYEPIPVE